MNKEGLLKALKHISDVYFKKQDYISYGQINRAIDVVEDFDGLLPQDNKDVMYCDKCSLLADSAPCDECYEKGNYH